MENDWPAPLSRDGGFAWTSGLPAGDRDVFGKDADAVSLRDISGFQDRSWPH